MLLRVGVLNCRAHLPHHHTRWVPATSGQVKMNFEADLVDTIKGCFSSEGISYEERGNTSDLATRYCEMRIRRIVPAPRTVCFSDEIHDSLGRLLRESDSEQRTRAREAWGTVFYIHHLFTEGGPVTPFLSRSTISSETHDGLLWDYGMHHFHLNRRLEPSGFVERSGYLLFAVVSNVDAFFVDVRPHRDPEDLQWVRQDLLTIMHSNWPEILEPHILRGVSGATVTDEQKKELRRKNVNMVPAIGQRAIAPLGGGTMSDGSSLRCRYWAAKLIHEIRQHEAYFYAQPSELRTRLESRGIEVPDMMEFRLVLLEGLNPSTELIEALDEEACLSRDLSRMGFAIVEATSHSPIVVSIKDEP